MAKSSTGKSSARPHAKASDAYHHGDLRAALLATAREALETTAPEDITLKSLALRLAVSQPAPYRHFANRDALLAAVAADGFVRFREALVASVADVPAAERLERSCLAYLAFGRANRGVYRLMFASSLMRTVEDAPLSTAASASFDFLVQGLSGAVPANQVQTIAIWVWSTLHGLVMLEAEGLASGPHDLISAGQVVHQMVDTLAHARRT